MNKVDKKHNEIVEFCLKNSDEKIAKKYAWYFKEGYDAYGIDKDLFISQAARFIEEWQHDMSLTDYLDLGDKLISTGKYEEAGFANMLILSKQEQFTEDTFNRIGNWLENGIQNWGNTDALCMSVLSVFLEKEIISPEAFLPWNGSESKWKRRAVPVTFVEAIKAGDDPEPILEVINDLMDDSELDVQKGLGTLLREIWKKFPDVAEDFLMKWKDTCGRKIIHYATEKMDKTYRTKFKKSRK